MAAHPRARRRTERAATDASLLDAAARADSAGVRAALARGADINAVDAATGHSAVTCAIAGDSNWEDVDVSDASFALPARLDVLRTLLRSDGASLYALNAPVRGVTPLGLAAWLNLPDVVRVLLEESRGLVAVDGTDAVGVTPLMYTARDGAVEAASHLLAHGARPDLRDAHHRTAVHHALRHPRLLWLCEASLRKQRLREYLNGNKRQLSPLPHPYAAYAQSFVLSSLDLSLWPAPSDAVLSTSTAALIRAVVTGDLPAVHQILFPPSHRTSVLVNRLDSHGWSALHYCVCAATPSVEILDALFLAGADTSLYTSSKHGTPLHCLARKAIDTSNAAQAARLHVFVNHLVRELRAPLAAADEEDETCLHVAAESGLSMEVLLALLACDGHHTVREMKNARGLTPLDVARPELRLAFGPDAEPARSNSVASFRTIRPSTASSTSTSSYASLMTIPSRPHLAAAAAARFDALSPLGDVDTALLARRILENLSMVCAEAPSSASASTTALVPATATDALELAGLRDMLDEAARLGEAWVHATNARIRDAARDLRDARARFTDVDALLQATAVALEEALGAPLLGVGVGFGVDGRDSTDRARRRTTDSGDSDATAVSGRTSLSRKWRSMSDLRSADESGRLLEGAPGQGAAEAPPDLPCVSITEEFEDESAAASEKKPAHGSASASASASSSTSSFLHALLSPTPKELAHKPSKQSIDSNRTASPAQFRKDPHHHPHPHPHHHHPSSGASGTAKLKAWLRKKLRIEIADGAAGETRIVLPGQQTPRASPAPPSVSASVSEKQPRSAAEELLPVARQIVQTASRDLSCVEGCMDDAEQFIALATNLLSQTDRRLKTIISNRQVALESSRFVLQEHLDDPFMSAIAYAPAQPHAAPSTPPPVPFPMTRARAGSDSDNSLLSSPSPSVSAGSSTASLADTLIEGDEDADVRAIRRLLTRRVDARTDGALDEVDKAMAWLRIVQDTLRGLRRRAHAATLAQVGA